MRVDELINELQELVADAKTVPLSGGKVMVEAEKIYDILEEIQDTLPAEVRQAKNIVADRGQIIAEAKKESEDIIRAAEDRKKAMIEESEIMRAAKAEATELLNEVKSKSAEMRKAANDYVENIMKKTDDAITAQLTELRKTRQNLRITKKS
ncbi:MAG: ATPase [Ruminococcus sp.]|nr:ATPase [Ruminococcus sp.]MBQ7133901.1 ATPase [Ruminococcus sp.]